MYKHVHPWNFLQIMQTVSMKEKSFISQDIKLKLTDRQTDHETGWGGGGGGGEEEEYFTRY